MEVAFYHDDPCNRIATSYDSQSSPDSVDSINSTDTGPVTAIASAPSSYLGHRFGQDFGKVSMLKNINLQTSNNVIYSSQQQTLCNSDSRYNGMALNNVTSRPNSVPNSEFVSDVYASVNQQGPVSTCVGSTNSLSLNIPTDRSSACSMTTPELVNMIKSGPDFDQMLPLYSQPTSSLPSQGYPRILEQDLYGQNYSQDQVHNKQSGSNPNIASSSALSTVASIAEGSPCSAINTPTNVILPHPQQFQPSNTYFNAREVHHEGPSTSSYGTTAGSTVHHMGDNLGYSTNVSLHGSVMHHLKEEPQIVPVMSKSPPLSPIDMEHQELIKTERKRLRNRVAASKCRKRKLERISRLEDKVNNLKTQNLELSSNASLLRQQVADLKSKVMSHVTSGCRIMMSQQQLAF